MPFGTEQEFKWGNIPIKVGPFNYEKLPFGLGQGLDWLYNTPGGAKANNFIDQYMGPQGMRSLRGLGGDLLMKSPLIRDSKDYALGLNDKAAQGLVDIFGPAMGAVVETPLKASDYIFGTALATQPAVAEKPQFAQMENVMPGRNPEDEALASLFGPAETNFSVPYINPADYIRAPGAMPTPMDSKAPDFTGARDYQKKSEEAVARLGLTQADLPAFLLSAIAKAGLGGDQELSKQILSMGMAALGGLGDFKIKQKEVDMEKALKEAGVSQQGADLETTAAFQTNRVDNANIGTKNEYALQGWKNTEEYKQNLGKAQFEGAQSLMPQFEGGNFITQELSPDKKTRNIKITDLKRDPERALGIMALRLSTAGVPNIIADIDNGGVEPEEAALWRGEILKAMTLADKNLAGVIDEKIKAQMLPLEVDKILQQTLPEEYAATMQKLQDFKRKKQMIDVFKSFKGF